ncbi:sulfurtransferase [Burkholderia dolosa]|uniref:sulfurtransferase n=1 Tax=Burkholderia dolosa TaxID=152500 RepID=UPI001B9F04D8|nr:sulfurtransferase [Burkholderia dolosa]MBR8457091.1 sulfurtransferase [Burkholderia dolosa]MDN7419410.1 sulfurtransferase [Burkholderia dolosa]
MTTPLLISPAELHAAQLNQLPLLIFDCSYNLADPTAGRRAFAAGHVPGAIHADISLELSAAPGHGASGGRHPLPQRELFSEWLADVGLCKNTHVIVYDQNRNNFCGRLWWMLRWVGHEAVSILDGGLETWKAFGGLIEQGQPKQRPIRGDFQQQSPLVKLVDADYVRSSLSATSVALIDARAPERYAGQIEPLDAVAGHIPGALNRPFADNFDSTGRFKTPQQLRQEFAQLFNGVPAEVIHYCGSGVSATPNVIAFELAGLGQSTLYGGSWSDWSARSDEYPKVKKQLQ